MTTYPLLGNTETQASPADTESTPPTPLTTITWDRVGLIVLLIGTAVMYLWDITINGMGNQFYAAAAQAGSTNWEALLFGSLDPHNFITVDKPPVSQWVMGLSGQIFGFNSASMLIPQALMAVFVQNQLTSRSGRDSRIALRAPREVGDDLDLVLAE